MMIVSGSIQKGDEIRQKRNVRDNTAPSRKSIDNMEITLKNLYTLLRQRISTSKNLVYKNTQDK